MRFHAYESSPGSSSDEDGCGEMEMSPTILLAIAIQKRRALFGLKERDYRLELLQTLCKHLGERRARRLKRGGNESCGAPITRVEPIVQNCNDDEPSRKRQRDGEDPFGLDDFFVRVCGRSVTIRG
uniref:WHIM1 domain-containing protein n=1 Tax=Angiostrongylus cantonensis TaxID=6313 RepID=A0A0K0D892_ANGCA